MRSSNNLSTEEQNNIIDTLKFSEQSTAIQLAAYFEKKWRKDREKEEKLKFTLTKLKNITGRFTHYCIIFKFIFVQERSYFPMPTKAKGFLMIF